MKGDEATKVMATMGLVWKAIGFGVVLLQISTEGVNAQTSPEQEKSWFFLQKLAKDIRELEGCAIISATDGGRTQSYLEARRQKVELFVDEIDAYIKQYAASRSKNETLKEFRFRVWDVAIAAGNDSARSVERLTPAECSVLLP